MNIDLQVKKPSAFVTNLFLFDSLRRENDMGPESLRLRDGPLENLGGGGERSTKKYSHKGKLNEKNSCMS